MKPFKSDENNFIDLVAVTVGTITIYSGIIFSQGEDVLQGFYTFTWVVVLYFNAYFILNWTHQFLISLEIKNQKLEFLINAIRFLL